jgi:hypothetical protein
MEKVPNGAEITTVWTNGGAEDYFLPRLTISVGSVPVVWARFDNIAGKLYLDFIENNFRDQTNVNPIIYAKVFRTCVQEILKQMRGDKPLFFHAHSPIIKKLVEDAGGRFYKSGDDDIGELTKEQLKSLAHLRSE